MIVKESPISIRVGQKWKGKNVHYFTHARLGANKTAGEKHGRRKNGVATRHQSGAQLTSHVLKKTPYEKLNAANNGSSVFPARGQNLFAGDEKSAFMRWKKCAVAWSW